ncbi:MAG: hypothetical protein GY696_19155 [Gammaproteobacteria bacterium]|nr:hypothetical protein [Gammaproteobacteria bacterium]
MEELLTPPGGGLIGSPSPRVKVNQGPAWFTFTFLHPGEGEAGPWFTMNQDVHVFCLGCIYFILRLRLKPPPGSVNNSSTFSAFFYNYLLPPTPTPNKKKTFNQTSAHTAPPFQIQKYNISNVSKRSEGSRKGSVSNSDVRDPLAADY